LKGPSEVQLSAGFAIRKNGDGVNNVDTADVGLDLGADSLTNCSRGSRDRESCAPASRGPSIHLAQARKSRFADRRTMNTARTI
jgi:hypothetical protein